MAKDTLVFLSTSEYESIYQDDLPLSRLGVNELVEISLVLSGNGLHRVLNEVSECRAGDMYILEGGIPHGFFAKSAEERPTVCTLAFAPAALLEGEQACPESEQFCCGIFRDKLPLSYAMLNAQAMQAITDLFHTIAQELETQHLAWQTAIKARVSLLLITVARYIDMAETKHVERPREWITVSAAMREILDRCDDGDISLESIAGALFVSKSHLSRMFQRVTGESFANYVRGVRIGLACNLLRTTGLSNEEIVGRCGLKDIPSFYRLFKSYMEMTPYQYRMSQTYQGETKMSIYLEISENLQRGKAKVVAELVKNAIDAGHPAAQILKEGLLSGMNVIGEKFKNNEVYVPEVLVAARAMNMGMQVLKPLLIEDGVQSTGRVCIGTVQGDLHDIGKNLVKMMMEGKGLEVIDLGTDVAPETFIKTAIEQDCQVICCSALLTTTMDAMAKVVEAAKEAGIRDKVKIMIGGAPVTDVYCQEIGADMYTSDAASAADAAVELCK